MFNRRIISIIIVFLMAFSISFTAYADTQNIKKLTEVHEYDDIRSCNLSGITNNITSEMLKTLTFDGSTVWPDKSKMPSDISPKELIEYGKDPGLNIRKLHAEGYTGKGISVALFDQPLLPNHEAYRNVDYTYKVINPAANVLSSMHGPAVMSLLAGKDIGTAPDVKVYYYAYPSWLGDQKNEADLFYDVIEKNKTLPDNEKIRIISMSHGVGFSMKNYELLEQAEAKAREAGIIVIDVCTTNITAVKALPFTDKNDPNNYVVANWVRYGNNCLYVPAGRTTADGYSDESKTDRYAFWEGGGLSWTVPYIAGVISLGLQVNPSLTEKEAIDYLYKSGFDFHGGKLINPEGFVKMVKENCINPIDVSLSGDYRYFLYNSSKVTDSDMQAINAYLSKFNDGVINILKDVSQYNISSDIYSALKDDSNRRSGELKGIQIFGASNDVPAFDIHYKIQMENSIDEGGTFKSDFFYSNFDNNINNLMNDFSIYKAFNDKLNINFVPQWPVSRLPLSKGEIEPYMKRVDEYAVKVQDMPYGHFVNFSSPIFASSQHSDDMGYFMRERLDKDFNILSSSEYRLYGNKQGAYPVQTDVIGDFIKENIGEENKNGINEFIINSHGQWNNIDQCVFTTKDASSEERISFLNNNNINDVLSNNYYDLDLWNRSNANNLDDTNLVHEAMSNGKCVSTMAASSLISNNGVHNDVSLADMKKNNFFYFYYNYFYNRASGKGRSESFYQAQKAYPQEILKNTDMMLDGNYQFNLHNVLSYHYLGLLEYWNSKGKDGFNPGIDNETTPNDNPISMSSGNLVYNTIFDSNDFKVNSLKAEKVEGGVRFLLDYESNSNRSCSFFNPPNGDKILKIYNEGIHTGHNRLEFKISDSEYSIVLETDSHDTLSYNTCR